MGDKQGQTQGIPLSRRSFVAGSGAALASACLATMGPNLKPIDAEEIDEAVAQLDESKGEWRSAACWWSCGGRCMNKVLVVDGIPVRQKTDDTHEDTADFPQQRGCMRGRANRRQIMAADRLKYPMKRKHWEPFTGGDKSLRGEDEWERITWDEAISYIAAEIKNAIEKYGNRSIVATHSTDTEVRRVLFGMGGCTSVWDSSSPGAFSITASSVGGSAYPSACINDRFDLRNTEVCVMFGSNPAWSAPGMPLNNLLEAKRAGARFICIDPLYTDTCAALDAQWVPVRPSTDTALILGMCYVLVTEDDPDGNPLVDWDFLERCTIGFDAEHMPEGYDPTRNFKDYLLGTYDATPKDPAWASEICGVDEQVIHDLAYEVATGKRVSILSGWAPARAYNQESYPHALWGLGCITGHIGKTGEMCGVSCRVDGANGGPQLVSNGSNEWPELYDPIDDVICTNELWSAILTGTYHFQQTYSGEWAPLEEREIDLHVLYNSGMFSILPTYTGGYEGVEAFKKLDFVVTQTLFPQAAAQYSDIVLPVCSQWELPGHLGTWSNTTSPYKNREFYPFYTQVIDPIGECKSDGEIARLLATELGLDPNEVLPGNDAQWFFNMVKNSTVVDEDGVTPKTLVTITQNDIDELGVAGEPQEGVVTWADLKANGGYQVRRSQDDNYGFIAYQAFREDPDNNPISTESGKFELFCPALDRLYSESTIGGEAYQPVPSYVPSSDGYEQTFSDWENKVKGEYPFQRWSPHYMRRAHVMFDNVPVLREAFSGNFMMNTADAAELGIEDGDAILVTAPNGAQAVRNVTVTNRVMKGVLMHPHGAWNEIDPKTGIDFGANSGYLTTGHAVGAGVIGTNSQICKIEKWTGEAQLPDTERSLYSIELDENR